MTSKTILEYRSRDIVFIPVIWMFPNQNPMDEDEACSMQSTRKLKVFYAMTLTMTLVLQRVVFGMLET